MPGIASPARRRPKAPAHKTWGNHRSGRAGEPAVGESVRASESLDDARHRPWLPSCPADRPRDLYGSLLRTFGIIGLREPAALDFAARVLGQQPAAKADDLDRLFPRRGEPPVLDIIGQCQISFVMLWTAPATGIAMCQNVVDVAERL